MRQVARRREGRRAGLQRVARAFGRLARLEFCPGKVLLAGELDGTANVLESLPAGCVRYLNKPFHTDALFDALRSVIDLGACGERGCP